MSHRGAALLHCLRCVVGVEHPETQTTSAERAEVAKHARGALRAAEIGVYEGVTTAVIAGAMAPEGKLYGIDPFFPGRLGIAYAKIITVTTLRRRGVRPKVQLVERLSADAASVVPSDLDFVFIDGDHSYEAIVRDWADWSAKVRAGGIIALHDTQAPAHNPHVADYGSARYFREHIRHDVRFEIVASVDSLNVLRHRAAQASG